MKNRKKNKNSNNLAYSNGVFAHNNDDSLILNLFKSILELFTSN